jgi:ubiquitin C-terminal hydrolase
MYQLLFYGSHTVPLKDFFTYVYEPAASPTISSETNWLSSTMRSSLRVNSTETPSICDEFYNLIQEMFSGESSSISPNAFLSTVWKALPTFKGYRQQDAQEFMRCLLDRMDHELQQKVKQGTLSSNLGTSPQKSPRNKFNEEVESEIGHIFGGLLQNEITCLRCGHISRKDDPFLDLSLDIPEPEMDGSVTLTDCLKFFTDVEMLEETEKYHCEKCNSLQRISKKFTIKKAPEVSRFDFISVNN